MRSFLFGGAVVFLLVASTSVASAAFVRGGEDFVLPEEETINTNLYVGAANARIHGEVDGDITAAGGNVVVTGQARDNMLVAGGTVQLLGEIEGDARVVGGNITISGPIGGDLAIAGGNVQVLPSSSIGGDVIMAGGSVVLGSDVSGSVWVGGGNIRIDGDVDGNVIARSSGSIRLGAGAVVQGDMRYWAPSRALIGEGADVRGAVSYNPIDVVNAEETTRAVFAGIAGAFVAVKFLSLLVAALLLAYFMRKPIQSMTETVHGNFLTEAVRGFIVFVVLPVAAFLLLFSIFGLWFAILGIFAYGVLLVLASVVSVFVAGSWLYRVFMKTREVLIDWKTVLIGLVFLTIIEFVPILGPLVGFVFFVAALGGVSQHMYDKLLRRNNMT